jgi:uncharacterized membrane protein (UPF0127 family)
MRFTLPAAMFFALSFVAAARGAELSTIPLVIGTHRLIAEVAATPKHRATGLMHRFSLRPDHGMLFVFEQPDRQGFWMKNTFIPLSIAFIGDDGRIVNIEDMSPQAETTHWSREPVRYALEMRKGWFGERGIRPGDRVHGLPGRSAVR